MTIIEKLCRDKTVLPKMHDIAGLRVVLAEDAGRAEQDQIVKCLVEARVLDDVDSIDRRTDPSHGYRAVHLIGQKDGLYVEIQVRTHLQHLWAQVNERLCDYWGRGVKYGKAPKIDVQKTAAGIVSSKEVLTYVQELSVAVAEREMNDLNMNLAGATRECRTDADPAADELQDLRDVLQLTPHDAVAAEAARSRMQQSGGGPSLQLFVYDRDKGSVLATHTGSNEELLAKWRELDVAHRTDRNIEIVLLAASSGDVLFQTHGRYVADAPDLVGPKRGSS